MRRALLSLALIVAACGGSDEAVPADAAGDAEAEIDAPTDPYEGRFDEGSEFPRTGCRAGALAGFARTNIWATIGLRTDTVGGSLRTFRDAFLDEEQVPHILTADDLILRKTVFIPENMSWLLEAIDICEVLPDGTLRGSRVFCHDALCFEPRPFEAAPTHRIAGETEGMNITRLGELRLDSPPMNVRVVGDVAYLTIAKGTTGLRAVSIANPAAPVLLGSYVSANPNYLNDIKLLDAGGRRYAVLAGSPSEVIDVTTPASPGLVAQIPVDAHTVFIEGTMAYFVTGSDQTLYIYDLADPRAPARRAAYSVPDLGVGVGFHDLYVTGGIAYLSAYRHGLVVVDCRVPTSPAVTGKTDADQTGRYWHSPWLTQAGSRAIIANGDEGQGSGLRLLDGDPASATYLDTLGEWQLRDDISIHNVMARGATVYLSHYQDGIRVLDITNPASPTPIAYYNTWNEETGTAEYFASAIGLDIDPARRRIYVADTLRGLLVLEGTQAVFPP